MVSPPLRTASIACCAAALLVPGLGGCSSPPAPSFEVKDVTLAQQTEHGYVIAFLVEAENRGPDGLPLRDVNYALTLDGREVFRGQRLAEVTVRRFGKQFITLPVSVALAQDQSIPTGRVPYRFEASVVYEIPGSIAELLFDSDIRRPSVSFAEGGQLDFASIAPSPGHTEPSTPSEAAPAPAAPASPSEPAPAPAP